MRSLLFTPGDSDRKLTKGLTSGADVILIDLEDAVAANAKAAARENVTAFLSQQTNRTALPPLYVRINDLETQWARADIEAIVPARPAGIMLPKARSVADVDDLASMLDDLESEAGVEAQSISILVIAPEIPAALLNMPTFQKCGPRVTGITWGSEDLAAGLGSHTSRDDNGSYRDPMQLARTLCLCAGSAAGIHAIDTVYPDFRDLDGLKKNAKRAAADGFSGKLAIHPDQVPIINEAFTPGDEEIAQASKILAAFEAEPDAGVINLDGSMIDRPHLIIAKKLLERAGRS
jgi:citrate lyase subunit beta/citryl-CoA lyase